MILVRSAVSSLSGFIEPLDAAAVHEAHVLVAVNLEQPEAVGGKPIVVVAVEDHRVAGRDACLAQQFFEFLFADDVAADLVLQLALPVETDCARDVARVVGLRVDVDLDQFDPGLAEVLLHPVGVDQNFGMGSTQSYGLSPLRPAVASSGMCLIMLEVYLKMLSGKIMTPKPRWSRAAICSAPSRIRPELGPASKAFILAEVQRAGVSEVKIHFENFVDQRGIEELGDAELGNIAQARHVVAFGGLHGDDFDLVDFSREEIGRYP